MNLGSMESPGVVGRGIRSTTPLGIGARSSGIEHTPGSMTTVFHWFCGEGAPGWSQSSRCGNFLKAS